MKKYILILLISLFGSINLGVTEKYKPVASFEISSVTKDYSKLTPYIPLFQEYTDSIPTVDHFGRVRNGIIVQGIVDVLNTDPSGVKLTELELAYIRSIVGGLYLAGSWQKMKAVYGFVGGNAWKHKWNWKDMRDLNAAFRISWNGTVTHASFGIQGNGIDGHGDTNFIPYDELLNNNTHLSIYCVSDDTQKRMIGIGCATSGTGGNAMLLAECYTNNAAIQNLSFSQQYDIGTVAQVAQFTNRSSKGFFLGTRTGNNNHRLYIRGVMSNNATTISTNVIPSRNIWLLANNNSTISNRYFSNRQYGFASIGDGLTDQQAIQTSNVVTFAQGILNR